MWWLLLLTGFAWADKALHSDFELEWRSFQHQGQYAGQTAKQYLSFKVEPEAYYVTDDDKHTVTTKLFYRHDERDVRRRHFDVRQLDWLIAYDNVEIQFGIGKVFWGVTEAHHLVDIINQTDQVEDVRGQAKLGQPMLRIAALRSFGTLQIFYLPYFRARTFPGINGRLRGPLPIRETHDHVQHDIALRYSHSRGAWDIGLAHFHGLSREPRLQLQGQTLQPIYDRISQTSLDVQYTFDAWLWKLEAIGRYTQGRYFTAVAGGFEYTFYQALQDADIGCLVEYHQDNRGSNAPPVLFTKDVFVGSRVMVNDVQDTQVLAGIVWGLDKRSSMWLFEASRRLGDNMRLEANLYLWTHGHKKALFAPLRQDAYLQLKLRYYL